MASFWKEYPGLTGLQPEKIVGGLPARRAMKDFPKWVHNEALKANAKVHWETAHHCIVIPPTGDRVLYTLELVSPPSAPEPYQPKRLDGGVSLMKGELLPEGIIINNKGAHKVGASIEGI